MKVLHVNHFENKLTIIYAIKRLFYPALLPRKCESSYEACNPHIQYKDINIYLMELAKITTELLIYYYVFKIEKDNT